MSWLLLDGIVVVIFLYFICTYVHRGFVQSIIRFIGSVAAVVAACIASRVLSTLVYSALIREKLIEQVQQLGSMQAVQSIDEAISHLPGILANLLYFTYGEDLPSQVEAYLASSGSVTDIATRIVDDLFQPILVGLISVLLFVGLLIVLMLVVRLVARTFQGVNNLPVIGSINMLLGGLVGLLMGLLVMYVVTMLSGYVTALTNNTGFLLNEKTIEQTYLFRYIAAFNPLQLILF